MINDQRVPDDWIVSVFDSLATSASPARAITTRFVGTAPSAPRCRRCSPASPSRNETVGTTMTLEGAEVQSALARARSTHWVVALGVPSSVAEQRAAQTRRWPTAAASCSRSALGSIAAWLLSGSIAAADRRLVLPPARSAAASRSRASRPIWWKSRRCRTRWSRRPLPCARAAKPEREQLLEAERQARAAAERAAGPAAAARERRRAALGLARGGQRRRQRSPRSIVPDFADICRIDLLDKDGVLQRKLTHHVDPAQGEAMLRFVGARRVAPAGHARLVRLGDRDRPHLPGRPRRRRSAASARIRPSPPSCASSASARRASCRWWRAAARSARWRRCRPARGGTSAPRTAP